MFRLPLGMLVASTLIACSPEQAPPEERIRSIAPFTIEIGAEGSERSFSGTVRAAQSAALAFAVSGTIAEIGVTEGQDVAAGAVLAKLDAEPYELQVNSAQAQLQSARANAARTQSDLDRQRQLFEGGWVSPAAVEQYETNHQVALNDVQGAEAQFAQARRELERTQIVAPYDGTIADVLADPFTETSAGRPVIEINAKGALELRIDAPDRLADQIAIGAPVQVSAATVATCGCAGKVTAVGRDAGGGTTIPVTVALSAPPAALLPGMSATAQFTLSGEAPGVYIPFGALAAGDDPSKAYVFVYSPTESVVRRAPVTISGGRGDEVLIAEGLDGGDIIAAAGAGLLRDGQKVRLPNTN